MGINYFTRKSFFIGTCGFLCGEWETLNGGRPSGGCLTAKGEKCRLIYIHACATLLLDSGMVNEVLEEIYGFHKD